MFKESPKLFKFLPGLLLIGLGGPASSGQEAQEAQEGPTRVEVPVWVSEQETLRDSMKNLRREWEREGLLRAIQSGFLGIAETLAGRLLSDSTDPEERAILLNHMLQVQMAKGDLARASEAYDELQASDHPVKPLLEAYFLFLTNRFEAVEAMLEGFDPGQLNTADRAWYALLEALLLSHNGLAERANDAFLRAEDLAPTPLLRDHFEVIRLRKDLLAGTYTQDTISSLRESVRSMSGERGGFEAARLLALALNASGDQAGAIEVLNRHLSAPGLKEYGFRPNFLLLMGIIAGPDSTRGKLALRQLLSEAEGGRNLGTALSLLDQTSSTVVERAAFLADLDGWLQSPAAHPLKDRLLAYQAYLLMDRGSFAEAENSALELLDQFPNSSFAVTALRLLAHVSWNQTPPRYRTAADYLNRLRQRLPAGEEAIRTGILIADCYFLNEDFSSASDAYGASLNEVSPEMAPQVFFQRILAEIGADRPAAAARYLDEAYASARIGMESIWKAEWNLLDYLRRTEQTKAAFDRIDQTLAKGAGDPALPPELILRMEWVSARLSLEAGFPEDAARKAGSLLDTLKNGTFQSLGDALLAGVESQLLLLLGESEIIIGNKSRGLELFSQLRERFPQSGPAILSYLVESRAESLDDRLVSAQQSLVNLVDRFPTSEFAPIALWEAALNAAQRGLNIHLQDAISLLERLVTEYPDHGLVYYGRLKQGDLARQLNDFPTALLLYERLLNQYPEHPERYRAELSRADCLTALGSEDPSRYDLAAVIYERNCLLPGSPLPVRLESGYKWAHSLRRQGDHQGSEGVLWLLYERFILDEDMNQPILSEEAGRYWMARTLLDLGDFQLGKGASASAKRVYGTLLDMNLPGRALAEAKIEAIP